MIRFYSFSKDEVESMSLAEFNDYWEAITTLEAKETLLKLAISAYPMMKKEKQQAYHKKIHELAYPRNSERARRRLTTAELAQLSGAGMIRG